VDKVPDPKAAQTVKQFLHDRVDSAELGRYPTQQLIIKKRKRKLPSLFA
jgi:hypothetical protein